MRRITVIAAAAALLGACTTDPAFQRPASVAEMTPTYDELMNMPPPARPITVAVYGYFDQTGQYKASENVQTLSRAVPQGGTSILVKALQDVGDGSWFRVVERERLENLLRERQIIREMRARYDGDGNLAKNYLPPMVFAGVLFEGGIISYDSNTLTGGLGAQYLGIGGRTEYREDTVTVYLRAVSTNTGEVLKSVMARKTIFSIGVQASVFKYVGLEELLEFEAGYTTNEPIMLALKQAIEKAVIALVLEGAQSNLWAFRDAAAGDPLVRRHFAEKRQADFMSEAQFQALTGAEGHRQGQMALAPDQ